MSLSLSLSLSFSINASLSLPLGGMVPDKWLYNFSLDFHVYFNDTHAPDLTCPVSTMELIKIHHPKTIPLLHSHHYQLHDIVSNNYIFYV